MAIEYIYLIKWGGILHFGLHHYPILNLWKSSCREGMSQKRRRRDLGDFIAIKHTDPFGMKIGTSRAAGNRTRALRTPCANTTIIRQPVFAKATTGPGPLSLKTHIRIRLKGCFVNQNPRLGGGFGEVAYLLFLTGFPAFGLETLGLRAGLLMVFMHCTQTSLREPFISVYCRLGYLREVPVGL